MIITAECEISLINIDAVDTPGNGWHGLFQNGVYPKNQVWSPCSFPLVAPCLDNPAPLPLPLLRQGSLYEASRSGTNATDQGFPEVVHDLSRLLTPCVKNMGCDKMSAAQWSQVNKQMCIYVLI